MNAAASINVPYVTGHRDYTDGTNFTEYSTSANQLSGAKVATLFRKRDNSGAPYFYVTFGSYTVNCGARHEVPTMEIRPSRTRDSKIYKTEAMAMKQITAHLYA
jgi:hypothetical protein